MSNITLWWRLLFALIVSDFLLQNDRIAGNKRKFKYLLLHVAIYGVVSLLCCLDTLNARVLIAIGMLVLSHIAIDYWKAVTTSAFPRQAVLLFVLDQLLHFSFVFLAVYWVGNQTDFRLISKYGLQWSDSLLKWGSLIILNLFGGKYFTRQVIHGVLSKTDEGPVPINSSASELIGILERLLIMIAFAIGKFEVIGYLFAAKSIIRYL